MHEGVQFPSTYCTFGYETTTNGALAKHWKLMKVTGKS